MNYHHTICWVVKVFHLLDSDPVLRLSPLSQARNVSVNGLDAVLVPLSDPNRVVAGRLLAVCLCGLVSYLVGCLVGPSCGRAIDEL